MERLLVPNGLGSEGRRPVNVSLQFFAARNFL
jgi:hypothetical protein